MNGTKIEGSIIRDLFNQYAIQKSKISFKPPKVVKELMMIFSVNGSING